MKYTFENRVYQYLDWARFLKNIQIWIFKNFTFLKFGNQSANDRGDSNL